MKKTAAKKSTGPARRARPGPKKSGAPKFSSGPRKAPPARRAAPSRNAPAVKSAPPRRSEVSREAPRKKGGPLRSHKPGKNQVARPRVSAVPAPAAAEQPDASRPRALAIARAGLDKKAEDVLVLDVRGLTSYADYFVLMTADSERQAGAVADAVHERLKSEGTSPVGTEGYGTGRSILVDYGDVVAHVLSREARSFYDLEGLWADAPRLPVDDAPPA